MEEKAAAQLQLEAAAAKAAALEERVKFADETARELAAAQELAEAAKLSARQSTQLVRDLKAELAKQRRPLESELHTAERVARELADRLEVLLKENAVLREKVTYLQDVVQSLTAELSSAKKR